MTVAASSDSNEPAAEPLAAQDSVSESHLESLWQVHEYVNEYVRFADAKAAVLGAWASALIGALFTAQAHHFCSPTNLSFQDASLLATLRGVGALLSLGLLSAAVIAAFLAILPRVHAPTWSDAEPGFIFWESILAHRTPENFWRGFVRSQSLARPVAFHLYTLAKIASRKYHCVHIGGWLAFVGTMVAAVFFFFS